MTSNFGEQTMYWVWLLSVFLCAVCLRMVASYPEYQQRIPNGEQVPSPCDRSRVWMGVGHQNSDGGGARNPFGIDFHNNDQNWAQVCRLDSDGDGLTNGEELGDPDCSWTPGTTPSRLHNISHPGVCEPTESTFCTRVNTWLTCPRKSTCRFSHTGVVEVPFRFPSTAVPATRNSHYCLGLRLPIYPTNTQPLLAVEPVLDNNVVMHHMNFWGCIDTPDEVYSSPKPCRLSSPKCRRRKRLWTIGEDVRCTPASQLRSRAHAANFTFSYAVLELHWRNARRSTEHTDSSGIIMYYPATVPTDEQQGSPPAAAAAWRPVNAIAALPVTVLHVIARALHRQPLSIDA